MEAILRTLPQHDWITFVFMGIAVVLGLINYIDQKRLYQLLSLPFDSIYFTNYERSHDSSIKTFNVFLFLLSQIIFALFAYLWLYRYQPHLVQRSNSFGYILGIIFLYWLVKYLIVKFLSWVFDSVEQHKDMVYYKLSILFSISLYLLVFVVFGVYYFEWTGKYIGMVSLIVGILLLIRYIKFMAFVSKMPFFNLFYFILYLCALEIAPLILIYKWTVN